MCTAKVETFLFDQILKNKKHVPIHQISLMKNIQSFKLPRKKK